MQGEDKSVGKCLQDEEDDETRQDEDPECEDRALVDMGLLVLAARCGICWLVSLLSARPMQVDDKLDKER